MRRSGPVISCFFRGGQIVCKYLPACAAGITYLQSEELNKIYTSMNRQCHEAYLPVNVYEPAAYGRASEQT